MKELQRRSHPLRTERLALGHVVSSASVFGKTARFFVDFLIWKFFKKGHPTSVNSESTLALQAPEIAANSKAYPVLYKKSIKNPGFLEVLCIFTRIRRIVSMMLFLLAYL